MKKIITVVSFLLLWSVTYSQSADSSFFLPKYSIGITPSAFFNVYEGVQISQDLRIAKVLNLTLESAYIVGSSFYPNRKIEGVRLRPGIELIVNHWEENALTVGVFCLKRYIKEDFSHFVNYFEYNFVRKVPVVRVKDLFGFGMSLGFKNKLSDRFLMDLGFGFGSGILSVRDEIVGGGDDRELKYHGWLSYDSIGEFFMPIVIFNINISYAISK